MTVSILVFVCLDIYRERGAKVYNSNRGTSVWEREDWVGWDFLWRTNGMAG